MKPFAGIHKSTIAGCVGVAITFAVGLALLSSTSTASKVPSNSAPAKSRGGSALVSVPVPSPGSPPVVLGGSSATDAHAWRAYSARVHGGRESGAIRTMRHGAGTSAADTMVGIVALSAVFGLSPVLAVAYRAVGRRRMLAATLTKDSLLGTAID